MVDIRLTHSTPEKDSDSSVIIFGVEGISPPIILSDSPANSIISISDTSMVDISSIKDESPIKKEVSLYNIDNYF